MSGHSRWAQVKHKKALTDAKKGKLFSKLARLIIVAAKEKGADPAMNPKLRSAMEQARAAGMPKENIARAIERGAGKGETESLAEVRYEAYGPGGTAMIITGITDNKNRTTNEIKHILSEHGGKFAEPGSVAWLFKKMGAVDVPKTPGEISKEELSLALIDAGASDIQEFPEGITAYAEPNRFDDFKQKLQEKSIAFSQTHFDYVPKTPLSLNKDDAAYLGKLIAALDDHDDIQEIYTNVKNL